MKKKLMKIICIVCLMVTIGLVGNANVVRADYSVAPFAETSLPTP